MVNDWRYFCSMRLLYDWDDFSALFFTNITMSKKRKSKTSSHPITEAKHVKSSNYKLDDDVMSNLEALYGMKMPKDLQDFWAFCVELAPDEPLGESKLNVFELF